MKQKMRKDSEKLRKKGYMLILLNQQMLVIKNKNTNIVIMMTQIISE